VDFSKDGFEVRCSRDHPVFYVHLCGTALENAQKSGEI